MKSTNPLIGDAFFNENPTNILGEQTIEKGRYGNGFVKVKGSLADIERIDAVPVGVADFFPQQDFTVEDKQTLINKFVENENAEQSEKIKKERKARVFKKAAKSSEKEPQEVYTTREVGAQYNKQISKDELDAYYFTHPELNHKLLFDDYTNNKQELIDKGLICYEGGAWTYYYTYVSGNVSKKISNLQRDKEKTIDAIGLEQYDRQIKMLQEVKPAPKGFVGENKIILLPHSNFAKEIEIKELRSAKPELRSFMSLFNAFKAWLRVIPMDSFKKSNYREIIDFYLDNKSIPVDQKADKAEQARQEKNAINIRQRTKEEGDALFAQFLAEELLPEDQAKISYLWNEKFNSIVEPNLDKVPVCFEISKTFKKGLKFQLNPTQRQAVAFMMEKKSGLLAYSVGVGKTAASIGSLSQAFSNGLAHKGVFVVPTNTYDKWIGELEGYTDKDTGAYMHGLLPQNNVVGIFNLNPTIVKGKLKIYSEKDEAILLSIQQVIEMVNSAKGDLSGQKKHEISQVYPINWNGLESEYQNYLELKSSAKTKTFIEYVAGYLRDEYNYSIYSLGTIRKFEDGTIFVTTEVGLQRLGVSDANKKTLTDRLFTILSQGEATGDRESARDIAGLQLRIEQTVSSSMKNAKINIEDLGIDWACFDEAHYYKKLFTYVKGAVTDTSEDKDGNTKYKRDKSKYELKSGQYPSSRALSAFVLSHYVQSMNDNRNVIQLTATPFTNSPLEVFSMLTLTNYKQLEEMGLANMVDFFDTFMKINYDIKYTPQKTVVKDVVLTGYNNLSQLRSIIYSLMDKKDEGANLIRPVKVMYPSIAEGRETTFPMTQEQDELMAIVKDYISGNGSYDAICASALQDEIDGIDFDGLDDEALIVAWEQTTQREYTKDREDLSDAERDALINSIKKVGAKGTELEEDELSDEESLGVRILRGISMMRQITLSPFLYYKACRKAQNEAMVLPDHKEYIHSSPKLMYVMGCIKSVIDYHKERNEKISGQVIYMNAGVDYFPVIKKYIVEELGLKESQVGMVSGSMSKSAKETAKRQFLSGDILVLIGSSTISVGVDLQNNATVLYNCYYDWNPTDAAQIEGRIWRQGNRFAFVRIVYPQCYNSADPVIFEYLNSKTLRINEIWNRSSTVQELDLRDFNPKELQKKLITDPEEKASWEILEEVDKVESQVLYFENRAEMLQNAMASFRNVKNTRDSVAAILKEVAEKKTNITRESAIKNYKNKINEIVDKYDVDPNPEKMQAEINKYKGSRYDHVNDPEGKYKIIDYTAKDENEHLIVGDDILYADALKAIDSLNNIGNMPYAERSLWGDLYYNSNSTSRTLSEFRYNYKDMKAAEDKVLKPMGLTFDTALNPITDFQMKLDALKEQLKEIEATKPERIARIKAEMDAAGGNKKTVGDRIEEFASANEKYLSKYLIAPTFVAEKPTPMEELMAITEPEAVAVEETQLPASEMAVQEIVAPTNNLIIYGKSPDSKAYKAMNIAGEKSKQVSNLALATLIKPEKIEKAKETVDNLAKLFPTWDFKLVETIENKKWLQVKGDPDYVAPVPEPVVEEVQEALNVEEIPAEVTIPEQEEIVAQEEEHTTEAVMEAVEDNLEQKEEETDELTREVIENQIVGLKLILPYKSAADKIAVKNQIKALKMTLELLD